MRTFYDHSNLNEEGRLFPYSAGDDDQSGYVDFKLHPELIRTVLEDFVPYAEQTSVESFFQFVEWLNTEETYLETSDCAFRPPSSHRDTDVSSKELRVRGRLYLLYRDLRLNGDDRFTGWLCQRLGEILHDISPDMDDEQVIGFTLNPVMQVDISEGFFDGNNEFSAALDDPGLGHHLTISFWAYGDSEQECFDTFGKLVLDLWEAVKQLSAEIRKGLESS